MTHTKVAAAVGGLLLLAVTGCGSADPVKAQADVVTGGLAAGNGAQVTAALTGARGALAAWQATNSRLPNGAEFAAISGVTVAGGASVAYSPTPTGYCLSATSSGRPPVTRVWREPGGLQPEAATC